MEKIQNKIVLTIQLLTLIGGIIENIRLIFQKNYFNFFVSKDVGQAASLFVIILLVLIISLLKDIYVNYLNEITKNLKNLILFLILFLLLLVVYISSAKLTIPILYVDILQLFAYLFWWTILFIILTNAIINSIRNINFKEKKNSFPQTLLETIKKYGSIFTDKNIRIIGSYNIQPQDFNNESAFLNRNLFTVDNFLTDGKKYWWIKTDLEGIQIYFTKEITQSEYEKFFNSFKQIHPLIKND